VSELRALRDRLEALHGELDAARAPGELVSADELQRLGEELGALRARLATGKQGVADDEAHVWDALLAVRRVQGEALAKLSQYGDRGRGGLSPLGGLAFFGAFMGVVASELGQPFPLLLAGALVTALTAPGVGWYAWYRVRLARAIEVAQRLL
jgi:hypothetical protein